MSLIKSVIRWWWRYSVMGWQCIFEVLFGGPKSRGA